MLGLLYKEGKKPLVRQKRCLYFPPGVSSMETLPFCFPNLLSSLLGRGVLLLFFFFFSGNFLSPLNCNFTLPSGNIFN